MAATPFRRRKAARTARNLAIAEAALALAKDRVAPASRGSRRPSGKLLLLGGAVAAAGAAALLKRDKVAGLLPSRTSDAGPPAQPAPPQPSNYDAPGPVANTATPIPAPDPHGEPPAKVDERAEEAAAAAEAAAIGGTASGYAGPEPGEPAGEAFRPLAESGEGEAEGQEQAEAELADNATYRDAGADPAQAQIDDTIEQASRPAAGETPEPVAPHDPGPASQETDALQPDAQARFLPSSPTPAGDTPAGGTTSATPAGGTPSGSEPPDAAGAAPSSGGTTPAGGTPSGGEATTGGVAPSGSQTKSGDQPASAGNGAPASGATDETLAETPGGGISGRPFAGLENAPSEPPAEPAKPEPAEKEDDSDDWRTWSGRSINP